MTKLRCPACNGEGFLTLGDRHCRTRADVCKYPGCHDGWIDARTGETPQSSAGPDGTGYASDHTSVAGEHKDGRAHATMTDIMQRTRHPERFD